MKNISRLVIALLVLAALLLAACGSKEPPPQSVIIELLNEYHDDEGEYLWGGMNECLVEPDETDVVEAWGVFYTRTHIDGGSEEWVRIVKDSAGEWHISDREGCMIR